VSSYEWLERGGDHIKQMLTVHRSGASEVHIVSHMTRQATFADAQNDAKNKVDTEFVTLNNPAVSQTQ